MLELEYEGRRYRLDGATFVVGADPACDLVLEGDEVAARHVVLTRDAAGAVAVQPPAEGIEVLLNGLRLGSEPTPVLHGDKLEVGGHVLRVVSPERAGATRVLDVAERLRAVPDATAVATLPPPPAARLVSLTDGREYPLLGAPLIIGRDASADVVLPDDDVSRFHCEIVPGPEGFRLVDRGSNGTWVNDRRVPETVLLARGDRIRVGQAEFRFSPTAGEGHPAMGAAPPGAHERLNDTLLGVPISMPSERPAAAPGAPVLGGLLVRSGERKGERVPMRSVVVNVGRGEFNDLVLPDPSVSTAHARLQRRDDIWILQDLDSTNGCWVDGERVAGEVPLLPGTGLRFGEVRVLFDPLDEPVAPDGPPTRVVPALDREPPRPWADPAPPRPWAEPAPQPPDAPAAEAPGEAAEVPVRPASRLRPVMVAAATERRGVPGWVVALLLAAALLAAGYLVLG